MRWAPRGGKEAARNVRRAPMCMPGACMPPPPLPTRRPNRASVVSPRALAAGLADHAPVLWNACKCRLEHNLIPAGCLLGAHLLPHPTPASTSHTPTAHAPTPSRSPVLAPPHARVLAIRWLKVRCALTHNLGKKSSVQRKGDSSSMCACRRRRRCRRQLNRIGRLRPTPAPSGRTATAPVLCSRPGRRQTPVGGRFARAEAQRLRGSC